MSTHQARQDQTLISVARRLATDASQAPQDRRVVWRRIKPGEESRRNLLEGYRAKVAGQTIEATRSIDLPDYFSVDGNSISGDAMNQLAPRVWDELWDALTSLDLEGNAARLKEVDIALG